MVEAIASCISSIDFKSWVAHKYTAGEALNALARRACVPTDRDIAGDVGPLLLNSHLASMAAASR